MTYGQPSFLFKEMAAKHVSVVEGFGANSIMGEIARRVAGILIAWSAEGLGVVASGVGRPLYSDRRTTEKTRIDFARVCIEVDAGCELVNSKWEEPRCHGVRFINRYNKVDWVFWKLMLGIRCVT